MQRREDVVPFEVDDERKKRQDINACSEIYRMAREFFVDDPETRLSDVWACPLITPVRQVMYDYVGAESGEVVSRSEMNFLLQVVATRKRDGVKFYSNMDIDYRIKSDTKSIIEIFGVAAAQMESYGTCQCTVNRPCSFHSGFSTCNETLSSV